MTWATAADGDDDAAN